MPADLTASLRPWAIEDIEVGERLYRIPAHTADVWLEILLADEVSLHSIIPGLLEPDAGEHFEELIFAGAMQRGEWEELMWDLVGLAAGRDWWTALYLIGNAKYINNLDYVRGQLALHHIDATRISLAAWLDAVYAIFTTHMQPEDRQRFDMQLAKPPAGAKNKIDRTRQKAAFAELAIDSQ